MKRKEALRFGTKELASLDLPWLESSLLLCHVLGISREKLYSTMTDELSEIHFSNYRELIRKRKTGMPSAYITGKKEFWSRDFIVNNNVLVPRPDTEVLVETAIRLSRKNNIRSIHDLCTGSGCIAVSLALELPDCSITASDISNAASGVFHKNCDKHGADIRFFLSDLFGNISLKFDMIVSNPPYLTEQEVENKKIEGLFEPASALAAGSDGLDIIRDIIRLSVDYLEREGYLLIEASPDQCDNIQCYMIDSGFYWTEIENDLAGRKRVVCGKLNGNKVKKV